MTGWGSHNSRPNASSCLCHTQRYRTCQPCLLLEQARINRDGGNNWGRHGKKYPLVNYHSYWKLPFIVDLPIKKWWFSIASMLLYQRVDHKHSPPNNPYEIDPPVCVFRCHSMRVPICSGCQKGGSWWIANSPLKKTTFFFNQKKWDKVSLQMTDSNRQGLAKKNRKNGVFVLIHCGIAPAKKENIFEETTILFWLVFQVSNSFLIFCCVL